jgi:DHA1 family inner membrane transport protein
MSAPLAAFALMFGNFVIGVAILAPAGMLGELAQGLAVTIRDAGMLVTFGAVVLCVGSPLVTWATSRVARRTLLSATVAVVALGHAASAFAPNYGTLLALRLVMVAVAAIYAPQAASTIALIVPAKARPSAIAFVFLGWSLALAAGLPLVTFLAAHLGWRAAYGVLAALAILSLLLLLLGVPGGLAGGAVSLRSWGRILRNGPIILLLLITALTTSALFVIFTYLGPLLQTLLDAGPRTIGTFFALFGVAGFIGNVLATRVVTRLGAPLPPRSSSSCRCLSVRWSGRWVWVCSRPWPWASCCRDSVSRRPTRCSRHGWSPPRRSFRAPPSPSTRPRSMSARRSARRSAACCSRTSICWRRAMPRPRSSARRSPRWRSRGVGKAR